MQKGKVSKILDSIVVQTAFNRLKSGENKSYKDHLFLEMMESGGTIVERYLASRLEDWQLFQLKLRVQQLINSAPTLETLSADEFYREYLIKLAESHSPEQVTTLHAVIDIAEDSSTALSKVLLLFGVSIAEFRTELLRHVLLGQTDGSPNSSVSRRDLSQRLILDRRAKGVKRLAPNHPLSKYGRNLTEAATNGEIDPVIGRAKEIDRVVEILSRRKKNNPILIGEAGVGKSAVVEGLALRIAKGDVPQTIANKKLFSLDISSLVAGTKFRGEFEERLQQLIEALTESKDTIIFIDEIHTIVGAGATQGSLDTANILKPALARGELQVIGATTLDEYRSDIESDAALERRFQRVLVEPTTESQTLEILRKIAPDYENHHNVRYSDEALQAVVSLASRYITDRHFPDKAIDLLDEVGARAHIAASQRSEMLVASDGQCGGVVLDKEYKYEPTLIEVEHIESIITSITGIPVERVSKNDMQRLQGVAEHLTSRVVGQGEAVEKLAQAIYRSRAGLKESNKPIGVFLFVGPTGVGKTLLAKELSNWMFNSGRGLIRIDMSEYSEKHNVSRLIGSPPGYVGYGEGGHLSEAVRRQPYSVVLLDEIEKAHPEVFNSMLQIFDDGHLTDGSGRKVDFSNTIIIMTSNVGSRAVAKRKRLVGYSNQVKKQRVEQAPKIEYRAALEMTFAPEFLNRIDDIILFKSLVVSDIKDIIVLELTKLQLRLTELGYALRITDSAKQILAEIGYSANYGARALKRVLNERVEVPISQLIIDEGISQGATIVVEKAKAVADVRLKIA